jgi:hypothetical protein
LRGGCLCGRWLRRWRWRGLRGWSACGCSRARAIPLNFRKPLTHLRELFIGALDLFIGMRQPFIGAPGFDIGFFWRCGVHWRLPCSVQCHPRMAGPPPAGPSISLVQTMAV